MSQLKKLLNKNKDVDMGDQYDNDTAQEISREEASISEVPNFLEEASKSIHHNLEALHALIHQSNAEIPVAAEIVQDNCVQMNDIKISLASKTADLGDLAEYLKFYYKETCNIEETLRNANNEKTMDTP